MIRTNYRGYKVIATDTNDLRAKCTKIDRGDTNGFLFIGSNVNISSVNGEPIFDSAKLVNYVCTECEHINKKPKSNAMKVGFCAKCKHPLWNHNLK